MTPNIPHRPLNPDTVLCINRKMHDQEVKDRQAAFVDRFAQGCNGVLVSYQEAQLYPATNPWHIRGMKFTAAVQNCWRDQRTFYYTDNGYLGNGQQKMYFRIIKNHVHDIRSIIPRPRTRLDACVYPIELKNFTRGRKILIAPPSIKSLSLWGMDPEVWVNEVTEELKKYTDRPVEIRLKRPRGERMKENTMQEALADDVHCLITYNSVAACEAIMLGKPAITLGPNAAGMLCSQSLSEIEKPRIPTYDEREAWLRHLSYSQFTFAEMVNGTAWRILNEL
jgi:hypothetical protein